MSNISLLRLRPFSFVVAAAAFLTVLGFGSTARADLTSYFFCGNCDSTTPMINATLELIDEGSGDATAKFTIDDPLKAFRLWFEADGWNGIIDGPASGYSSPATPEFWGAGNNITSALGGAFDTANPAFSMEVDDRSESGFWAPDPVMFTLSLSGIGDFSTFAANVLNAVQGYRVLGHFGNCFDGDSCAAIAAPLPGAVWLFVSALLGLFGLGYRKRKIATA